MVMQAGSTSAIESSVRATGAVFVKTTVHVIGPVSPLTSVDGEADFATVSERAAEGRMVDDAKPWYLYLLPLLAAAQGWAVISRLRHRTSHV